MKKFILIGSILCYVNLFSQDSIQKLPFSEVCSPYNINENMLSANLSSTYPGNENIVQFTYVILPLIERNLQLYFSSKGYGKVNGYEDVFFKNEKPYYKAKYQESIVAGRKPRWIAFNFDMFVIDSNHNFFIKKATITGDPVSLINFFVQFYPTTINFETVKNNKIADCRFMQDIIELGVDPAKNTGSITITNSNFKNEQEFISTLK